VSGGDHRWFKRSTGKKRPVTRDIIIIIIIQLTEISYQNI
jgi:hypothetical protein